MQFKLSPALLQVVTVSIQGNSEAPWELQMWERGIFRKRELSQGWYLVAALTAGMSCLILNRDMLCMKMQLSTRLFGPASSTKRVIQGKMCVWPNCH
jgi:hypothetical protein